MVGLASLPYPLAAFISHKAQTRPRNLTTQSSMRVSSKLTKRKNYLRPKILKTLTKPYPVPPPTSEDPVTPLELIEPTIEILSEPTLENMDSSSAGLSETLVSENELDSSQLQVVQASGVQNVVGFSWFSGRVMVRIVASFVGLFVLQTVVAVWMMGSGDSDEKGRNLGIKGQYGDPRLGVRKMEVGLNGNALQGSQTYLNVDESEIEVKIAEIRTMAREARELEKKNSENNEADMGDVSEDDDDGVETETSKIRSGIVKEVDGRLTKLRKRLPGPVLNVFLLNKEKELVKEAKFEGPKSKKENDMLMFEMKHRFKSHSTGPRDKPEGFPKIQGSRDIKEKLTNIDNEQPIQRIVNHSGSETNLSDENRELNNLDISFPERLREGSDEKKPGSRSSSSSQTLKKGFGSKSGTRKLKKGSNGRGPSRASKKTFGSNSAMENFNEGAKPERGVVQDSTHENLDQTASLKYPSIIATQSSQTETSDPKLSATSEMHAISLPLSSDEPGSTITMKKITDKQQIGDPNPWWLTLPYVIVILMRKGPDSEGLEGFYTLRIHSDSENQSYMPYIVAFEDRNDARNFSYLMESVFDDLPDASIDVLPLSTKELKQVAESLVNKVIVVKKGKLQLYAGQSLAEVETALRSLVK